MRAARGRKGYLLTAWGMKASSQGMPMKEILATMKRLRRKTVAEIQEWMKAGGR